MSVRITRTWYPLSNARYSAVVSARRGVTVRSTAGSSARFMKTTERSSAPVRSKSSMNSFASSAVIPMAPKTTANSVPSSSSPASSSSGTVAWRAIWSESSLCGRPDPEKMGSFWPRTSVFMPSMAETPVWMNSSGYSRAVGLIAAPTMSSRRSGTISGPPSMGWPDPSRTRPSRSSVTGIFMVSPRKRTEDSRSMPSVPSNTWMETRPSLDSSTWPRSVSPSGVSISTISSYPMGSSTSANTSGPLISVMVWYSFMLVLLPELLFHVGLQVRDELVDLVVGGRRDAVQPRCGVDVGDLVHRDARVERLERLVVVRLDGREDGVGLLRRTVGVHVVQRVLLEERLADVTGDLERELLVLGQRVLADELDDLLEFVLLVEDVD